MIFPKTIDPKSVKTPHLITIPYSHYCELSRWALEKGKIEFKEIKYAPGYHAKAVGKLRSDRENRSESSYVGQESGVHGGRRKYAVPLLCLPDGKVLRDSWEILEYAMGAPDENWKQVIDQELGIAVRQIAYLALLAPESKHLVSKMISGASLYERGLWFMFGDKIMDGMRQLMAITPENVKVGQQHVLNILERAGQSLDTNNGSLQSDGGFGATELAFCSLAGISVWPDNFTNGAAPVPKLKDFSASFQDFVGSCRDTTAGQFVLSSYQNQR
jgi:glutathione S-transferase